MPHRGKFLTELVLAPHGSGQTWMLRSTLVFESALGTQITVPEGFVTDLASIPRVFWNILPPFGAYSAAAVVHDWCYRTHRFTRCQSDGFLLEAMAICRVPFWQRVMIHTAVRLFGWHAWRQRKNKP